MKNFLKIFLGLFMIFAMAQSAMALTFGGEEYNLALSSEQLINRGWINSYFKKGENVKNWTKMINVMTFDDMKSPQAPIEQLAKTLAANNLVAQVMYDPKTEVGIIDYIIASKEDVQFSIFKCQKDKNGKVIALQYAFRAQHKEIKKNNNFANAIKANRANWIAEVKKMPVPEINKNKTK